MKLSTLFAAATAFIPRIRRLQVPSGQPARVGSQEGPQPSAFSLQPSAFPRDPAARAVAMALRRREALSARRAAGHPMTVGRAPAVLGRTLLRASVKPISPGL